MKKMAEFGTGIHRVKFIWENACNETQYVQYRASSRKGVARILWKFLKALKHLNTATKNMSIHAVTKHAVPFGYLWLAARSPKCEIHTKDKESNRPRKQSYSFNYLFPNAFSLGGFWQRIILSKNS